MAGVKGRSGRHSSYKNLDLNTIMHLSNQTIIDALEDTSIPILNRAEIAKSFMLKHLPDKVESSSVSVTITQDSIDRLLTLYERNSLIRNDLETMRLGERKAIAPIEIDAREATTSDNNVSS